MVFLIRDIKRQVEAAILSDNNDSGASQYTSLVPVAWLLGALWVIILIVEIVK